MEIAEKYGYVDIDQTKLSTENIINLVNSCSHFILESGGSVIHMFWTNTAKIILLNYRQSYVTSLATLCPSATKTLNLQAGNHLDNLVRHKKPTVVTDRAFNTYLETGVKTVHDGNYVFDNLSGFEQAIMNNE